MRRTDLSPVAIRFLILGIAAMLMLLVPFLAGPQPAGAAPAFALQAADGDSDGLSDTDEAAHGTDPADADSDDDEVLDGGEINAGTDPLAADSDGDGFTDKQELDRGSDPLDAESVPANPDTNTLTVTLFDCPAGYDGKDLWTDCATPVTGVEVVLGLDASEFGLHGVTDANGQVVFSEFGPGPYTLTQLRDDEIVRSSAICFAEPDAPNAPEPQQVSATPYDNGSYGFVFGEDEHVTCDWFTSPAADDSDETPGPVTGLPSTGSGPASDDPGSRALLAARAAGILILLGAGVHRLTQRPT